MEANLMEAHLMEANLMEANLMEATSQLKLLSSSVSKFVSGWQVKL